MRTDSLLVMLLVLLPLPASAHLFGVRDLESLLREAPIVVRAEVVKQSGSDTESDPVKLELKILVRYKGEVPEVVEALGEGHHPLRPEPRFRGLFFLGPSTREKGRLAYTQGTAERWPIEEDAEVSTDALVTAVLKFAPQAAKGDGRALVYLEALKSPSLRISSWGAQRLALLARQRLVSETEWEQMMAFIGDSKAQVSPRVALVTALGALIPAERLLTLSRDVEDSPVRAALLSLGGERAAAEGGEETAERARGMLGAARLGSSPEVSFAAAIGLAELGDESALPMLSEALSGRDGNRRGQAILAVSRLAQKGSNAARAELKRHAEDPDPLVKLRAGRALENLYLNDPLRLKRSRSGLYLAGVAMVMLVGAMAVLFRKRA